MDGILGSLHGFKLDASHPANIAILTTGALATLGLSWVISDYRTWVSLGTGNVPSTPAGYWKMTKYRWAMMRNGEDMRDGSKITSKGAAYLAAPLPRRTSARPQLLPRTMPQRQNPAHAGQIPIEVRYATASLPAKLVAAHPHLLRLEPSPTEGGSVIALSAHPGLPGRDPRAFNKFRGDEVCHVHADGGSLHAWLAPLDAREVVSKGWGERFPMTVLGNTPDGVCLVYAPTTFDEVEVVEEIMKCGVQFLTGVRV